MTKIPGLKKTSGRTAVMSAFEDQKRPLDVSEIINLVNDKVDQATIYRTLQTFYKNGIVNRLEFGEGKFRYELNTSDHHHLICQNCGRISDIEDKFMDKWETEIKKTRGFIIKSHNLEFFGVCKKCQL